MKSKTPTPKWVKGRPDSMAAGAFLSVVSQEDALTGGSQAIIKKVIYGMDSQVRHPEIIGIGIN